MNLEILSHAAPGEDVLGSFAGGEFKLRQEVSLMESADTEQEFSGIVGRSSGLRNVLQLVEMVAATDSTVLLLGETGTGKELIARAIHRGSQRQKQSCVTLNCAAIPPSLFESELFGHERGAFTGANMQRPGRLELAD